MIQPMTAHAQPMTLDEWFALDEEVKGELVDGFLVEEEVPDLIHEVDEAIENVPGCEGLTLDVAALWAEVDALD